MRDRDRIYQEILQRLRARAGRARLRADRRQAEIEASHMTLIPPLLRCTDLRRHKHYLEIEKPRYIRRFRRGETNEFESLWAELEALISPAAGSIPVAATNPIPVSAADAPILLEYFNGADD